jgi:hypothetical protein
MISVALIIFLIFYGYMGEKTYLFLKNKEPNQIKRILLSLFWFVDIGKQWYVSVKEITKTNESMFNFLGWDKEKPKEEVKVETKEEIKEEVKEEEKK